MRRTSSSRLKAKAEKIWCRAPRLMRKIRDLTHGEFESAVRGHRAANVKAMDLTAAVALRDWNTAAKVIDSNHDLLTTGGALHLMAKRGDSGGLKWLVGRSANPNAVWAHWDSDVTALHLAVLANHPEIVRLLLTAGADPTIHDSKHDSDALGWAEFMGRKEIVEIIRGMKK